MPIPANPLSGAVLHRVGDGSDLEFGRLTLSPFLRSGSFSVVLTLADVGEMGRWIWRKYERGNDYHFGCGCGLRRKSPWEFLSGSCRANDRGTEDLVEKLRPWRAPLSFAGVGDSIGFYVNHSPLTNHSPRVPLALSAGLEQRIPCISYSRLQIPPANPCTQRNGSSPPATSPGVFA